MNHQLSLKDWPHQDVSCKQLLLSIETLTQSVVSHILWIGCNNWIHFNLAGIVVEPHNYLVNYS